MPVQESDAFCSSSLEKKGCETGRCELKDTGEIHICGHRITTNFKARSSTASQSDSSTESTVLQDPEDMTEAQSLLDFDCIHLNVFETKNEEKREETRYKEEQRGTCICQNIKCKESTCVVSVHVHMTVYPCDTAGSSFNLARCTEY